MALKITKLTAVFCLIAGIMTSGISGCTAFKTFPQSAKAGETVALAIGSADGMSRANTTAEFVLDAAPGTSYDLTGGIRGIFRLYADKTSRLYEAGSTTDFIYESSGHEAWLSVMAIDLPTSLPTGPGTVNITTTADYPTIGSHINDFPVALEILPGLGTPSDLSYEFGLGASMGGDLTELEPLPHAQIIPTFYDPPSSSPWPNYGAIEMDIFAPTTAGANIRFVADDLRAVSPTGFSMTWTPRDAGQNLTLMMINPRGKLRDAQLRIAIVLVDKGDPAAAFTATPAINSISYYDVDGNPVAGPPIVDYDVVMR